MGRVRWSGRKWKKMLEPSAKCERLLNGWAAQLSNWTCHRQDSEKNAKWPSKDWCSAFLSIFSFSSFSLVCCSVYVYFWALTLFLFFIFLHVSLHLSCCFTRELSYIFILYLTLLSLFLSLYFCLPFPLINRWHDILPAEQCTEEGVYMCTCVHLRDCERIKSRLHVCVCLHIGWTASEQC